MAIIILSFSCTNPQNLSVTENNYFSIKNETELRFNSIVWMQDLESTENDDMASDKVINYLPGALGLYSNPQSVNIYPSLKNFASLDITDLTDSVTSLIDGFLTDIASFNNDNTSIQKYLSKNRIWIPYIFSNKLTDFFPFSSWIYGKPYISPYENHEIFEIPVRLYSGKKYVDILVSLKSVDNASQEDNYNFQVQNESSFQFDILKEQFILKSFLIDQIHIGEINNG